VRRLLAGWSANLFQVIVGVTQQVALVPGFLHFWTSDVLAAWLVIYAIGNLIPIADSGLQFRAINRALVLLVLAGTRFLPRSGVLEFQATRHFDVAFIAMTVDMLLTLPSNLVCGFYGRAVWLQSGAVLFSQLVQLIVIFWFA
jgi:hypothetical protein